MPPKRRKKGILNTHLNQVCIIALTTAIVGANQ